MISQIPLSSNKLKYFHHLTNKKGREKEGLFMIEGKKLVQEAIQEKLSIHSIIVHEKLDFQNLNIPENVNIYIAKEADFQKLTYFDNPEGILGVIPTIKYKFPINIQNQKFFILDHIQDPGNLGTIFRVCDAFNINGLILNQCVEVFNPKVIRASMGAVFRIPFYSSNLHEIISLHSHKILKTELSGIPINQINLCEYQFIVLGNEANGILSTWNEEIPISICIPQSGKAESLNVGIASGILAWEWSQKSEN